jgi:hypothetical protein
MLIPSPCFALVCRTLFFGNYDVNLLAVALDALGLVSSHVAAA